MDIKDIFWCTRRIHLSRGAKKGISSVDLDTTFLERSLLELCDDYGRWIGHYATHANGKCRALRAMKVERTASQKTLA